MSVQKAVYLQCEREMFVGVLTPDQTARLTTSRLALQIPKLQLGSVPATNTTRICPSVISHAARAIYRKVAEPES